MKQLVVGMDGAHIGVFRRGWTPFLESLVEGGDTLELHEDLISRGWSEIITGEHGSKTGGVYDRPNLDGTHQWSLRFSLADIPGVGTEVKPVWQELNERGYRVGIMNVPTAFPAAEVDGFFVSGGGGGGPVLQDPVPQLCHPKSILPTLQKMGYIVDERLGSLLADKKLYRPADLFSRLSEVNERRTDAFIHLAEEHGVDFGFIVYKSTSNLAEFLLLPELDRAGREGGQPDRDLIEAVEAYYRHFDTQVERLLGAFPDTEVLLVSDHGMASREWSVNPNVLLQRLGFQSPSTRNRGIFDVVRFVKKLIPYSLRLAIRSHSRVKSAYESMTVYDEAKSIAFSTIIGDWNHGVFVNDEKRFGGPVAEEEIESIAADIVDKVNGYAPAREHGVSASLRPNARMSGSPHYPDVVLHIPDGSMTSNEQMEVVGRFEAPAGPLGIKSVTQGRLLCGKASTALAVNTTRTWTAVGAGSEAPDLRAVHAHILDAFPEGGASAGP